MPGFLALLDGLGPVVDGSPLGDGAAWLPSPTAPPPGPPTLQKLPELLAFLPGAVHEGVDRLARDGALPTLMATLEPAGDLLGRRTLQKTLAEEAAELGVTLHKRRPLAALEVELDQTIRRNNFQDSLIRASNASCNEFKDNLLLIRADTGFLATASSVIFGALGAAAGAVGSISAAPVLAGASGASAGVGEAFDSAYFQEQVTKIINDGIDNKRAEVLGRIAKRREDGYHQLRHRRGDCRHRELSRRLLHPQRS